MVRTAEEIESRTGTITQFFRGVVARYSGKQISVVRTFGELVKRAELERLF